MEYALTRRHPSTTTPSPRLVRSRSGAENNSSSLNTSQRIVNNRSRSTTRSSKNIKTEIENMYPLTTSTTQQKPGGRHHPHVITTSCRDGSQWNTNAALSFRSKSASGFPSAWALSPGRSPLPKVLLQLEPPGNGGDYKKGKVKSGVSGVLKYFRQKKVPPIQEEEYPAFKVLHNRLLQWRFANARAETAVTTSLKNVAEVKLLHVWHGLLRARKSILEKRIAIQSLKHEIKLYQIINSQIRLLSEWTKLEKKNCEAVCRVTGKLLALSVSLPLIEDAKGDVDSINEAMSTALEVMDGIETTITKFLLQVEKTLYLLTELTSTVEHRDESLEEMEKIITLVSELAACEKSVRAHLVQAVEEAAGRDQVH